MDDVHKHEGEQWEAIRRLGFSRVYVANLIASCCYITNSSPQLGKEVQLNALETRLTYRSVEDVMKKFIVTGNEIVESTIPLIIMFIEKGAFERINASFYQIVEWTQDMKDKLEGLKHRFDGLHGKLLENIQSVQLALEKLEEQRDLLSEERECDSGIQRRHTEIESKRSKPTYCGIILQRICYGLHVCVCVWVSCRYFHCFCRAYKFRWTYYFRWAYCFGLAFCFQREEPETRTLHVSNSAQKEEINIGIGNVTHKRDESRNATPHREINLLDMLVDGGLSEVASNMRDAANNVDQAQIYLSELSKFWYNIENMVRGILDNMLDGGPITASTLKKAFGRDLKSAINHEKRKMADFIALCKEYLRNCGAKGCSDDILYGFLDGRWSSLTHKDINKLIRKRREYMRIIMITKKSK